ncbi:alpha/beta fold hydrolase [Halobiforma nitratireducens]|uniref:Alpha/beta hydrolase fold protein n=1 Tax=Halobiforma nitratireducens JCM 10879 TaxID=1227454 RepID=M0LZX1_9EURY|nr:alpha/beta hydrolase [Halobiforma nitratireducens]EMA38723.1 alpha/beta hydrolase fold protein [Halobiforma nitratireducens JCM 10879]
MASGQPSVAADSVATDIGSSTFRSVRGLELHARVAGDETDPLVVLLHGFPEFWYGWHEAIQPLVENGYRVLVPDQRGYNRSEKPSGVGSYRRSELAADVAELIATEGRDVAHVVGHDWGGIVAWDLALRYPNVVDRLAVVNAPHPVAFRRQLLSNPEQLRRSWYAYAFQLPWLPERICRYDDYRLLERALTDTAAPGSFTETDLKRYRRAWGREGALTAMLGWYRASARYPESPPRERVDAPTLVAWGRDDVALVPELAIDSYGFCPDGRLELFPTATHWLPHENPKRLIELLCEHVDGA